MPAAVPSPRIAVGPGSTASAGRARDAVVAGGGTPVDLGADADGLVWLKPQDVGGLQAALAATPSASWVQLPWAGVEPMAAAGVFDDGRTWTSAKGSYAEPVAEHALALALAGLRHFPERIRAREWGTPKGTVLFDAPVTILGGGGIATSLIALLRPFRVHATVVRRSDQPVPGAVRTVGLDRLHEVLAGALVVFVALALTPETLGIIDAAALAAMDTRAWLVNVARGGHVVTDDLVDALEREVIAGAALDVTDPEPLPAGHRLWDLPNVIVTPHSADWPEITHPALAARITTNVARFAAGTPLEGLVDPVAGY